MIEALLVNVIAKPSNACAASGLIEPPLMVRRFLLAVGVVLCAAPPNVSVPPSASVPAPYLTRLPFTLSGRRIVSVSPFVTCMRPMSPMAMPRFQPSVNVTSFSGKSSP